MSAYSEWVSGCISDSEYKQACRKEDDRAAIEREMYIDACMDRCRECEMYDDESGECSAGEIATRCTII